MPDRYVAQGRYDQAEPLYKRALTTFENKFGPDNPNVGVVLTSLAHMYSTKSRNDEAETLYMRALAIYGNKFGPNDPNVASVLTSLGHIYFNENRYDDAERVFKRALDIYQKVFGPNHPQVAETLSTLALLYVIQGRYAEAEPLSKRAIEALGAGDYKSVTSMDTLAMVLLTYGRSGEALPLLQRLSALLANSFDKQFLGVELRTLMGAVADKKQLELLMGATSYSEAETEPALRRLLGMMEATNGPNHISVAGSLEMLGIFLAKHGRGGEAIPLLERSLSIFNNTYGSDSPPSGSIQSVLGSLYYAQGRYEEADRSYTRAIAVVSKTLGSDNPMLASILGDRADMYMLQNEVQLAADDLRESTGIILRRVQASIAGRSVTGRKKNEAEVSNSLFRNLIKTLIRLPKGEDQEKLKREAFEMAQWTIASAAAQSLAEMAARSAERNPVLARIVRERQDLKAEWQMRDADRIAAYYLPSDKRDEADNEGRLRAIEARIAEIDAVLSPQFKRLENPTPLSVEDVQVSDLNSDEALILFLDTSAWQSTPEESFIWVVTKTDLRWVRIDLGTAALTREVQALRCGLDARGAWTDDTCEKLIGAKHTPVDEYLEQMGIDKPLPFDVARAHKLYQALFGQIEDLIGDKKHLLLVPSGPLTALPFQVLVTKKPDDVTAIPKSYADYTRIKWLGQEKAISVLPSVASLKALRRDAKPSAAPDPYIAFANPLLSGKDGKDKRAWTRQSCPAREELALSAAIPPSSVRGVTTADEVRHLDPLPETADEACAVARLIGADPSRDVYLGARGDKSAGRGALGLRHPC